MFSSIERLIFIACREQGRTAGAGNDMRWVEQVVIIFVGQVGYVDLEAEMLVHRIFRHQVFGDVGTALH